VRSGPTATLLTSTNNDIEIGTTQTIAPLTNNVGFRDTDYVQLDLLQQRLMLLIVDLNTVILRNMRWIRFVFCLAILKTNGRT